MCWLVFCYDYLFGFRKNGYAVVSLHHDYLLGLRKNGYAVVSLCHDYLVGSDVDLSICFCGHSNESEHIRSCLT